MITADYKCWQQSYTSFELIFIISNKIKSKSSKVNRIIFTENNMIIFFSPSKSGAYALEQVCQAC